MNFKYFVSICALITITTPVCSQVTLDPDKILVNRDNVITSAEVLGISRNVTTSNLFGGMYAETKGQANGRPFYGFAIDNAVKSYTYYDGADDGIHTYLAGPRQSIWKDSMQWVTDDGSIFKFHGYKLDIGKDGNTIIGYNSVLNDSPNNLGNTVVGSLAAQELISGVSNSIFGNWSGWQLTSGDFNTLLGTYSGEDLISGSRNTMVGYYAGKNTGASSTGNVFLGYRAGENETSSNKLYIANSETADPLIYGNFTTGDVKVNGDTEVDGTMVVQGTSTHNGLTIINDQLETQDIKVKDSNPYIQFYQNNTAKYYMQYQNGFDQFVIAEVGEGQVLRFKNGEVYLPQLAGTGTRNLRIGSDGKIEAYLPNPYIYIGLSASDFGSTVFLNIEDLQNGITLTSMETVVHCFGSPIGAVQLVRFPIAPSGPAAQIVYEINPPGNGCGTWTTTTVVTAGSNVIDTNTYNYYFQFDNMNDASAFSQIKLHH